jgi:hypothetical protein
MKGREGNRNLWFINLNATSKFGDISAVERITLK